MSMTVPVEIHVFHISSIVTRKHRNIGVGLEIPAKYTFTSGNKAVLGLVPRILLVLRQD